MIFWYRGNLLVLAFSAANTLQLLGPITSLSQSPFLKFKFRELGYNLRHIAIRAGSTICYGYFAFLPIAFDPVRHNVDRTLVAMLEGIQQGAIHLRE